MVCFTRIFSALIAAALLFLLPLPLHAEWYSLPAFFSDEAKPATPPAAADSSRQTTGAAAVNGSRLKVKAPEPVKPLVVEIEPASGNIVAKPASEAIPVRTVVPLERTLAPFSPSLALRSRQLSVDSEWRGEVYVNGGITVMPAATLTIQPGTLVRFTKGSALHVLGRIVVKGSVESPVRLTSVYREAQESDWGGIYLSGSEKRNLFEHVVIEGADAALVARFSSFAADHVVIGSSARGLQLQSANATVTNSAFTVPVTAISAVKSELFLEKCSISGGQSGVVINSSAVEAIDMSITSCRLTAFSAGASQLKLSGFAVSACQTALRLSSCDGSISDSAFTGNLETGVVLGGSNLRFTGNIVSGNRVGIQLDDNLVALWANTIVANSSYNLIYLGDEPLFAGGNNFGSASTVENENKLFSKRPGTVQIVPLLTTAPADSADQSGVLH